MLLLFSFTVVTIAADEPLASRAAVNLFRPLDYTWEGRPVGDLVRRLAQENQIELAVDPRVDVRIVSQGRYKRPPLEQILAESARFAGGRMVVFGDVVFLGTMESADRAASAAVLHRRAISKYAEPLRRKLGERRAWEWDERTPFEQHFTKVAGELGLKLVNGQELTATPARTALHEAATVDVLFLWAALADLTWRIDEKEGALKLIELPEKPLLEKTIRGLGAKLAATRAEEYQQLGNKDLEVVARGDSITLRGPWSALWDADRLDRRRKTEMQAAKSKGERKGEKAPKATPRYTATLRNVSLEAFAASLEQRTKRKVVIDEASLAKAGKDKTATISCVASGLDLDEFLRLALTPSGFHFIVDGDLITIGAGAKP